MPANLIISILFGALFVYLATNSITFSIYFLKVEKQIKIVCEKRVEKILDINNNLYIKMFFKESTFELFVSKEAFEEFNKCSEDDVLSEKTKNEIAKGFYEYHTGLIEFICKQEFLNIYNDIFKFRIASPFQAGWKMAFYSSYMKYSDFINEEEIDKLYKE